MKTNALRYGFAIPWSLVLIALACGATEKDGSGSEPTGTEDSSTGGSGGTGTQSGNAANTLTSAVTSTVTATGATSSALTSSTTSSGAGGDGNTSMGGSGNSAGGTSSGAGGAAGAPMTNGCGDCEPTTESFGDDDCQVWICFGAGAQQLVDAGCEALPTQVPRYCCPKDLTIDCE